MDNLYIYPYKLGSESVKKLKEGMGIKSIKLDNSNFKGNNKVVLNWGNTTDIEEMKKAIVINPPALVKRASNKKLFFELAEGIVSIPEFTDVNFIAKSWLDFGKKVIVRESLSDSGGKGIVMLEDLVAWENYDHTKAKLYVKYVPKKDEYRIHVMRGDVIDAQKKILPKGINPKMVNWQVRNHSNGFIFIKQNLEIPEDVFIQAVKAVEVTGLDFGAVDVIWNNYLKKAFVLEVNTAPGLEGSTVDNYIEGITNMYNKASEGVLGHKPKLSIGSKYFMNDAQKKLLDDFNIKVPLGDYVDENDLMDEDDDELEEHEDEDQPFIEF